jgi:hypothetical protein
VQVRVRGLRRLPISVQVVLRPVGPAVRDVVR